MLDTPDMACLSAFYAAVAGVTTTSTDEDWTNTRTPEGWTIAFQLAPDHVPPRWPGQEIPQQMHLDLLVPDLATAVDRATAHGATRLPGGGPTFAVLADPAGHPFCLCQREGVPDVQVSDVAIDCPDGGALARFYGPLLGMEITYEGPEGAMIAREGQPSVMFQNVEGYRPPRWPDPARPQQFHLDVTVTDIDEAEPQVLALGATRLPGEGGNWRVYADPAGHPFCLVW